MTLLESSNTVTSGVHTASLIPINSMQLSSKWVSQRVAADYLGVSERTLLRWRQAGYLKPGDHFVRKFSSANSPLVYCLERCEEQRNLFFLRQPLEVAQ